MTRINPMAWLALALFLTASYGSPAPAAIQIVPFDTAGSAAAQTAAIGVNLFVSNSFLGTQGINGSFTGNAGAPIGPPGAIVLGLTSGEETYFHFSPLPGFEIHSIGISATGAFINQSTTFRTFAAFEDSSFVQFDTTMTPTDLGIAGLNGGAVFLQAASPSPITAFRVWQLDNGFGILDNLVVDVQAIQPVPEPASIVTFAGLGAIACAAASWRRKRLMVCR